MTLISYSRRRLRAVVSCKGSQLALAGGALLAIPAGSQLWRRDLSERSALRPRWLSEAIPSLSCDSKGGGKESSRTARENRSDGLWHEAHAQNWFSYPADQVLDVISDVQMWETFVPWCSKSILLDRLADGRQHFEVHFGISVWPASFVGDVVVYELTREAGRVTLRSVNDTDLKFADHLEYVFHARQDPSGCTEVNVTLLVHARKSFFLELWRAMESSLVDVAAAVLSQRMSQLYPDEGPTCVGVEIAQTSA
eukprot:CAMPEP_0170579774 /NCGR_PEP_ID=MMETSP0224-20130122/6156_1 /TAXON_ID=285029 /ORGANISM="Togula jolla, Strain CCCM 725" /LENGTH=252 /DNA_ID=CAMNT_0010902807 /DNA_START=17 /DNA_END=775 /DNA_ORIENTATION=-